MDTYPNFCWADTDTMADTDTVADTDTMADTDTYGYRYLNRYRYLADMDTDTKYWRIVQSG